MYEYRTTTHWGQSPPNNLLPPEPDFRLRELMPVIASETDTNTLGERFNSWTTPGGSGNINIPVVQSVQRSRTFMWVAVWERYADKENG